MPHRIEWIVPDHLVCVYMQELITAAEVGEISTDVYNQLLEIGQRSDHLVHFIVDSTEARMSPLIKDYMSIDFKKNTNLGWSIMTGSSGLMRMVLSVFARVMPGLHIANMDTVAEAVAFLGKRDFAVGEFVAQHPGEYPDPEQKGKGDLVKGSIRKEP
jgi:hypothetical protein